MTGPGIVTTFRVELPDGGAVEIPVDRKRVKTLRIRVLGDGTLRGSAPVRAETVAIQSFLDAHAGWIARQLERAGARADAWTVPLTGPDAGTLPLWGELVDAADALAALGPGVFGGARGARGRAGGAEWHHGARALDLAALSPDELARRIDTLYKREVARAVPEAAARHEAALGVSATRWTVRAMTSRWGSCTPATGAIRINGRLAAYPPACLDAVVAHELVHLRVRGHGTDFHALLDGICPGNRAASRILRLSPREAARR